MANQIDELWGPLMNEPNAAYTISFAGVRPGRYAIFCVPHMYDKNGNVVGTTITTFGAPLPITLALNAQGEMVATVVTAAAGKTLPQTLKDEGVQRFRYLLPSSITSPDLSPMSGLSASRLAA